jgi:hypothetical protein
MLSFTTGLGQLERSSFDDEESEQQVVINTEITSPLLAGAQEFSFDLGRLYGDFGVLSDDLILHVAQFLGAKEIAACAAVNMKFNFLFENDL